MTEDHEPTPGRPIPTYSWIVWDLGPAAARLMQQIVYWSDERRKAKHPEGVIYKAMPDLVLELGMPERSIRRAAESLELRGLISREHVRTGHRGGSIAFLLHEEAYLSYYDDRTQTYQKAIQARTAEKSSLRENIVLRPKWPMASAKMAAEHLVNQLN